MANPRITAELYLKLHQQQVVTDLSDALLSGTDKAMRGAQKTISNAWRDAVVHGLTSGKVGEAQKALLRTGVVEAGEQYKMLLSKAEREHAAAMRSIEGERDDKVRNRIKQEADAARTRTLGEASEIRKLLDERGSAYQKELALQSAAAKEQRAAAKDAAESLENAAQGLRGVLSGGPEGMLRGLKGFGQKMHAGGESRIDAAKDLGSKGGDPKQIEQMAKMGRAMAGIGSALATIAAVVGVVVLLVKLFADLESKIKGMNQALIGTAGAADFGLSHADIVGGKLTKQLEEMRNQTTELNKNFMRFRAGAKEQQQVLSELNKAGYTYAKMNDEIKKGASHLKSYSDATALAITYSRNLGVSTGEISQKMGEFTFETGMGLQDIAEQFSVITREAMVAGFATKRFYSTIVEVTSGMAYYGVRIDETAQLLRSFDSLLGEAVGTEAFKKIIGQYKDKGAQDRIRELIVKDQEFAQEQFSKAFERQIRNLAKTGDKLGLSEKDMRELLNMDELGMSAQLQQRGASAEQIQDFRRTRMTGQAATGDLGAMTLAMPFAGAGFDVAMASQATEVFGGKRIDEVLRELSAGGAGAAELAALTQVTGKSLDELVKLGALFTDMDAAMINMRDYAKIDPAKRTEAQNELLARYGKELGLFIDEQTGDLLKGERDDQGRLIKGTEVAVKDALEAVSETTTLGEDEIKEQLTKDQEIATEISSNITGLNEIMEQGMLSVLNDIYDVLVSIANVVTADTAESARVGASVAARDKLRKAETESANARKVEQSARQALDEARAGGDKKTIELAEKTFKEAQQKNAGTQKSLAEAQGAVQAVENLSNEAINKQGAGFSEVVDAIEANTGEQKFRSKGEQKQFTSALEDTLPRISQDLRDTGMFESPSDFVQKKAQIVGMDPKEFASEWTEKVLANPEMTRALGGEESVRGIGKRGQAAVTGHENWEDLIWSDSDREEMAEMFSSAVSTEVALALRSPEDQAKDAQEMQDRLMGIQEAISGDSQASIFDALFSGAQHAKDLVIPAGGGKPIVTDEKDTLMAFQPGGPIAGAMGGGGGGNVEVNIYGGDQKKIYDTVMKALKAVGRA